MAYWKRRQGPKRILRLLQYVQAASMRSRNQRHEALSPVGVLQILLEYRRATLFREFHLMRPSHIPHPLLRFERQQLVAARLGNDRVSVLTGSKHMLESGRLQISEAEGVRRDGLMTGSARA